MNAVRFVVGRLVFTLFVTLLASFFVIPMLWLLVTPFNPRSTLAVEIPSPATLHNFELVFANSYAVRALLNSAILGAGGMVLNTFVACLAAYALSRTDLPGRDILTYILILFSSVVTGTAAMVPIFLLIYYMGLSDSQLGVILVFTGGLLPTAMFIMRDFVEGLPRSYEESAMVSGATPWQMFRDVVLPLVRPGIMVVAIWTFVNTWGAFLIPFILLRSPDVMPASVAIYSFYTEAGTPIITLTSAYALLYSLPVLLLYLFVNWRYGFRFFGGIKR
jgi:multiple sugar transport system permease protein